jgi:cytoskeletal protein RodZ
MVNQTIAKAGCSAPPSDRKVKNTKGTIELPPLAQVGDEIGKARKRRRMSTLRMSQITRIPERYVRSIEAGDFASLPGKPYVFGFTRTICTVLALDADACIATIKAELGACRQTDPGVAEDRPARIAPVRRFLRLRP